MTRRLTPEEREAAEAEFYEIESQEIDTMVSNKELEALIDRARERGAIIRTKRTTSESPIDAVQVRKGIPGCGPHWMPALSAAERLRQFLTN
jgi:hypothetical protein